MKEQEQRMEEKKEQKNPQEQQSERKKRIVLIIALAAVICIILLIAMVSCQPQQKNEAETPESGMILPETSQEGLESDVASSDIQPSNSSKNTEGTIASASAPPISSAAPKATATPQIKSTPKPTATKAPQPEATKKPATVQQPQATKSGHYEKVWVVDKKATSYEEDVYEEVEYAVCTNCGYKTKGSITAHIKEHMLNGESAGHKVVWEQEKTGTKTVSVPEEGHHEEIWVED